ncbi:hypothetical protein GC093_26955 [Paenibacillus sp. LMG 31456]|uniref:Uncharacterized protein n=1 Tax=Paenibacillus foliorum TaxID=2654974 RepID=A0A972K4D0_9BACL|nr:hypothetical protein [Paenibacillus foliorum]NOU96833.1 hypothetical protein [Paenibacillus foliorum]
MDHKPRLGIQGPVVAWQDSWAGDASDLVMRTGTGSVCPSQDPKPEPEAFLNILKELDAEFYVHHVIPGLEGDTSVLEDVAHAGIDICLGNEYGNINGPWTEGTNRYDVPDEMIVQAGRIGRCIGLLYDEPEHLQINVGQYRKDGWFPHWGQTEGLSLETARNKVEHSVYSQVQHVQNVLKQAELSHLSMPLITEQVFPTLFHTLAKAGMDLCPKIMKESFQSLQLSTALGAAKQYGRAMWICADLWGPDTGEWFTRFHGFPGHSPQEFESALKLGYYMGPTHLFTENIDVLMKHTGSGFKRTEFGEVWKEFTGKFVPENPITWDHSQVDPDIVIIHSDDSNYGQNERLFGNPELVGSKGSQSIFQIWHLLSRGTIPAHGSCMHIPGYNFPRHELKREIPLERFPLTNGYVCKDGDRIHPLFYPVNNVLVYDEQVSAEQLGQPQLIVVGGSALSSDTLAAVIQRAKDGSVVVIADWLLPASLPKEWTSSGKSGLGQWIVTHDFLDDRVREAVEPFLGKDSCWMQRFGTTEVRMSPKDSRGFTLEFELYGTGGHKIGAN